MSKTPAYQRFFAELKRRKVFRVAAVYGAVAFIVLAIVFNSRFGVDPRVVESPLIGQTAPNVELEFIDREGTLAIGDGAAQLDRPIYFVGLVCRNKRRRDLWIDRKLVGNVAVDFGLQSWSVASEERCVQIRDLILPGQVGWGDFEYVVLYDGRESCPRATAFAPELAAFTVDGLPINGALEFGAQRIGVPVIVAD